MKKFLIVFTLYLLSTFILSSCADGGAYRRRHGGYDSQTWTPRKHRDINLRTYSGYPRGNRR